MINDVGPATVEALLIPGYKNLGLLSVPWSEGIALVGRNGAGKTNILEAAALVMGSDETVRRCGHRPDFAAAVGMGLIVGNDAGNMPIERETVESLLAHPGSERLVPRAASDAHWWSTVHDSEILDALPYWDAARVLYRLESIERAGGGVRRRFARYLLAADDHRLLRLPHADRPPVTLQWLPASRTGAEMTEDLLLAFERASGPAAFLADRLGDLLPMAPPAEGDSNWWLREVLAEAANAELTLTSAEIRLWPDTDADASVEIQVEGVSIGTTYDEDTVDKLSAGQRRWLDEAFATAALQLDALGDRCRLYASVLSSVSDDELMTAVMDNLLIDQQVALEEFWDYPAFKAIVASLEPALVAAARQLEASDPTRGHLIRAVVPELAIPDQRVVVRVFDEPEAHLHPTAQRRVARAVRSLRNAGQNVLVASHSAAFIDPIDFHTMRVHDGCLESLDGRGAARLARDLGLNRGELLTGIEHLLIVEGPHDRLMLETFWEDELRSAGIAVLRMFGTDNLMAVADMEFVERYLDVPMTVMLDYTNAERVRAGRAASDEERKLQDLRRAVRKRGRTFDVIGLSRPDVVCYLNDRSVKALNPSFPGWNLVLNRFEERVRRPSFKKWLLSEFGVDLMTLEAIQVVLDHMRAHGHPPVAGLVKEVNTLLSRVDAGSAPSPTSTSPQPQQE